MSPDLTNEDGLTALHQCCIDDNEEMMKILIDFGANVNARDSELWTPLHAAATCGHVHLAEYLLNKGADILAINSDGNMPYDICEDEVTLDYIESVMSSKGITQEEIDDLRSCTAKRMLRDLTQAVDKGQLEVLECRDCHGATPLHLAAANGYIEVADFLLDHNVRLDVKDNDGWQPIHAAACWAQPEMVYILAMHGADLDARTYNDEMPFSKFLLASVRRTSMREKKEISRRDAKAEAELMLIPRDTPSPDNPPTSVKEVRVDMIEDVTPKRPRRTDHTAEGTTTKNVTISLEPAAKSEKKSNKKGSILKKQKQVSISPSNKNKKSKGKKEKKEKSDTSLTKADKYYQDKFKHEGGTLSELKRQRLKKFQEHHSVDSGLDESYQPLPSNSHKDSVDLRHQDSSPQPKPSAKKPVSPVAKKKSGSHNSDKTKSDNSKKNDQDANGMGNVTTSSKSSSGNTVSTEAKDPPIHRFKGEVEEPEDAERPVCCVVM
uniref:Protein phosphatase 1 regulatory inhibitor subunit 16B-like n=1 Tax=Saccoglossus kowalevskii TaxID=10224 RepID=A0ABM0MXL0_SACKO|nr:PREDICTED: protein phosphatase 1 regulatory inhibitor subunit 16B-like [Saccoglossus kowalevskii]